VSETNGWRPIEAAPKDGTPVLALIHADLAARTMWKDHERLQGIQFVARHPGLADDGFDLGWQFAAPVGFGGIPDHYLSGWQPLPLPPEPTP
jgi:hypothetical protein